MSAGDLECRTLQGEWIRTTPSGMIADFTGSGDSSYDTAEECFAACREEGETLRNGLDDGTSPEKSFACHAVSDTTNAKPIACLCALALLLDSSLGVFGTGGATIVCGLFSYQCPIVAPMRSTALTSVPRQLHEQRVLQFTLTFHEWLQTYKLRMWCIAFSAKPNHLLQVLRFTPSGWCCSAGAALALCLPIRASPCARSVSHRATRRWRWC